MTKKCQKLWNIPSEEKTHLPFFPSLFNELKLSKICSFLKKKNQSELKYSFFDHLSSFGSMFSFFFSKSHQSWPLLLFMCANQLFYILRIAERRIHISKLAFSRILVQSKEKNTHFIPFFFLHFCEKIRTFEHMRNRLSNEYLVIIFALDNFSPYKYVSNCTAENDG